MSIDYSLFAFPKPGVQPKKIRTKIQGKKHRQTKATEIPPKVKEAVWERDDHRCIFCNKVVTKSNACCHLIPRSAGGKGVEQNIFTACNDCHRKQDNGFESKEFTNKAKKYLREIYGRKWKISELIYKKYE